MEKRRITRDTLRYVLTHHRGRPADKNGEPVHFVAGYCKATYCSTRWHQWPIEEFLDEKSIPLHLRCPSCGRRMYHYEVRDHWPITGQLACSYHPGPSRLGEAYWTPMPFSEFTRLRTKKKCMAVGRSRPRARLFMAQARTPTKRKHFRRGQV